MAVGGFAGLYAVAAAAPLLQPRDQFVAAWQEQARLLLSIQPQKEVPDRDAFERVIEREGDAIYARRGAALPLYAMSLILSGLLFLGCARMLRREAWGLSAFELAAVANIPYHLLDATFGVIQARDLAKVAAAAGVALPEQRAYAGASLVILKSALAILYFGGCALYLRRSAIRALFPAQNGEG
jgi:hypothetical protein